VSSRDRSSETPSSTSSVPTFIIIITKSYTTYTNRIIDNLTIKDLVYLPHVEAFNPDGPFNMVPQKFIWLKPLRGQTFSPYILLQSEAEITILKLILRSVLLKRLFNEAGNPTPVMIHRLTVPDSLVSSFCFRKFIWNNWSLTRVMLQLFVSRTCAFHYHIISASVKGLVQPKMNISWLFAGHPGFIWIFSFFQP